MCEWTGDLSMWTVAWSDRRPPRVARQDPEYPLCVISPPDWTNLRLGRTGSVLEAEGRMRPVRNFGPPGWMGSGQGDDACNDIVARPHGDISHDVPAEEPGVEGVHVIRRDNEQGLWSEPETSRDGFVLAAPVEGDRQHHETCASDANDVRFEHGGGDRNAMNLCRHSVRQSMNTATHAVMEHPIAPGLNPTKPQRRDATLPARRYARASL